MTRLDYYGYALDSPPYHDPPNSDPFRMRLLRRVTATALSSVLLVQLMLLSGWERCAMAAGAMEGRGAVAMSSEAMGHAATSSHDMTPVGPGAGALTRSLASGQDSQDPPPCDRSPGSNDCRQPWSPGHCTSMSTCAGAAARPVVPPTLVASATPGAVVPRMALALSGPTAAPELPPPRV